jgi:hypothetical protein
MGLNPFLLKTPNPTALARHLSNDFSRTININYEQPIAKIVGVLQNGKQEITNPKDSNVSRK